MIFRYFILIITLCITFYLGLITVRNISYYYQTKAIQTDGYILKGWVVNLDEDKYEITFKMGNGDLYKGNYSSDFYQFALNDTLNFKYLSKYSGEYIHINENPSEMFIIITYMFLILVLVLVIGIYYQVRRIIYLINKKSVI